MGKGAESQTVSLAHGAYFHAGETAIKHIITYSVNCMCSKVKAKCMLKKHITKDSPWFGESGKVFKVRMFEMSFGG